MKTIELYKKLYEPLHESLLGLPQGPTAIQVLKLVFSTEETGDAGVDGLRTITQAILVF